MFGQLILIFELEVKLTPYGDFQDDFRVRVDFIDHIVRGALSPPHTSRALGSATQGHAQDRDLRAAIDIPKEKTQLRQTYSRRSARVATRPKSQSAPPHIRYSQTMID